MDRTRAMWGPARLFRLSVRGRCLEAGPLRYLVTRIVVGADEAFTQLFIASQANRLADTRAGPVRKGGPGGVAGTIRSVD